MKNTALLLLTLIIAFSLNDALCQEVNLTQISETLVNGSNHWVEIQGHFLYVATGYGLKVYDIADPNDPQELTHIPTDGYSNSVEVYGTRCYVSDSNEGLLLYDITEPDNPIYMSSFNTPGAPRSLLINGNYVYLFAETNGIQIVNAEDPYNMELSSVISPVGEPAAGVKSSGFMYVSVGVNGVAIYNIVDPENPVLQNTWNTLAGRTLGLSLSPDSNYLMVSDWFNGCYILKLTSPYSPSNPGSVGQIMYSGEKATFSASQASYSVSSFMLGHLISYNYSGVPLDTLNVGGDNNMAIANGYAYVCQNDSLLVIDCEPPQQMQFESAVHKLGFTLKAEVYGDYVYVANTIGGLAVVDISDPLNPVLVDSIAQNVTAYDLFFHPDTQVVYVSDYSRGVHIFDTANPAAPVFVRTIDTDPDTSALKVIYRDGYLYVDVFTYGINVFDAADPFNPVLLYGKGFSANVIDFDLTDDGEFLFASAPEEGIYIFRDYTPDSLQFIQLLGNFDYTQNLDIRGDYCYVADYDKGVYVLDISNPYYPILLDSVFAQDCVSAVRVIDDQYIAVSDRNNGDFIVDVSNPMDIFEVSRMETPGLTGGFAIKDSLLICCDNYSLIIADMYYVSGVGKRETPPGNFSLLYPAYPNPFNSSAVIEYEILKGSKVKLTLFNTLGQEIAVLADGYLEAGKYSAPIDGSSITSGIYYVSMECGGVKQAKKIVLLK